MTDLAFAIHLGDGLYLDSNGALHRGPAPETVIYEAPFKLPIDAKKAGDALQSVKKGLEDFTKNPDVLEKFEEYGLDLRFLNLLASVSKIAGTIAPVFAVAGFAIDVLKMFGLFKDGPSALELLVKQRFEDLETQVHAIGTLIQVKHLAAGRIAVESFAAEVKDHVAQLNNVNLSVDQLELDRATLRGLHGQHVEDIASLFDPQTWQTPFDRDEHKYVWPYMQHNLFTLPGGPKAPPAPARLPADEVLHFDHRLMVPLVSFAAASYLACIRGISPEFRTTGDFRTHVRDFANKIDALAQAMREHVLARTIYTAEDFQYPALLDSGDVVRTGPLFGPVSLSMSPTCSRFPVGSLDLRYHGDGYFHDFLSQLIRGEFFGWPHTTKHGGMDLRWQPPATLERFMVFAHSEGPGEERYTITNPEECAVAANLQSEKDYADLLAMSGYTQLLQLAVLFRNEATEPNRSQTVQCKLPDLYREPQTATTVTIESESIPLTGVITSFGRREPQKCTALVGIWTQPIKRARPVEYVVKLRTLRAIGVDNRWREPSYADFQDVRYEQDPGDPQFKRLAIEQHDTALGDHTLISGSSPRDTARHAGGVAQMMAHTFDWWIPVKPPFSLEVPLEKTVLALRAAGWGGPTIDLKPTLLKGIMRTMSDQSDRFADTASLRANSYPKLSWRDGTQDWDGEHRDPRIATVTIGYSLDWDGDRMYITLTGDPADRNYVVYVVVEEKLPGSGKVLHTAVPIPVNGQLTYVPQAFFDQERKANQKLMKTASDFIEKYGMSTEIGPVDPVVAWVRPGDLASTAGLAKIIALAERHRPELLREVMAVGVGKLLPEALMTSNGRPSTGVPTRPAGRSISGDLPFP